MGRFFFTPGCCCNDLCNICIEPFDYDNTTNYSGGNCNIEIIEGQFNVKDSGLEASGSHNTLIFNTTGSNYNCGMQIALTGDTLDNYRIMTNWIDIDNYYYAEVKYTNSLGALPVSYYSLGIRSGGEDHEYQRAGIGLGSTRTNYLAIAGTNVHYTGGPSSYDIVDNYTTGDYMLAAFIGDVQFFADTTGFPRFGGTLGTTSSLFSIGSDTDDINVIVKLPQPSSSIMGISTNNGVGTLRINGLNIFRTSDLSDNIASPLSAGTAFPLCGIVQDRCGKLTNNFSPWSVVPISGTWGSPGGFGGIIRTGSNSIADYKCINPYLHQECYGGIAIFFNDYSDDNLAKVILNYTDEFSDYYFFQLSYTSGDNYANLGIGSKNSGVILEEWYNASGDNAIINFCLGNGYLTINQGGFDSVSMIAPNILSDKPYNLRFVTEDVADMCQLYLDNLFPGSPGLVFSNSYDDPIGTTFCFNCLGQFCENTPTLLYLDIPDVLFWVDQPFLTPDQNAQENCLCHSLGGSFILDRRVHIPSKPNANGWNYVYNICDTTENYITFSPDENSLTISIGPVLLHYSRVYSCHPLFPITFTFSSSSSTCSGTPPSTLTIRDTP